MSRSQAKVRFIIEEKVRFVDESIPFRSKSIVFKQSPLALSYNPQSTYPFPHFHIPTREEEWLNRRNEAAAAAARESNASSPATTPAGTPQGNRKRKAAPTATAPTAVVPPVTAPPAAPTAAAGAAAESGSTRRSSRVSARDLKEEAIAAAAAAAAQAEREEHDDEEEDEEAGEDEVEDDEEGDEEDDDDAGSGVSDLSNAKKRNSRMLSRSSHMSDEGGNAPTPVPEARLTSRQRALGGKGDDELLSIPNLPLKSKDASSLTEEQLARKAAANERRRISEKERMEKEKAETIQRLLNKKAPTGRGKRGRKSSNADGNDETLGEIPRAARIPRSRKGGDDDGEGGEGGEGDEDDEMVDGEEGDENESKGIIGAVETSRKWKYNCVLHRNYIEIDGGAKRTKIEDYATPLPAALKYSLSFPVSAPLPDSLFPLSSNVSHLTEYYAQLLKSRRKEKPADDAEEEAEEEKKESQPADASATAMEVDSGAGNPATTAEPAAVDVSTAAVTTTTTAATPAPPTYHMAPTTRFATCSSCSNPRKYSDSLLALPVCSIECLKNVRKTSGYQKVAAMTKSSDKQIDDAMHSVLRSINSANPTSSQSLDELREEFRKRLFVLIHNESASTCSASNDASAPHRLNSCAEASRYGISETTAAQLEGSVVAMLQKYRTELLG